MGYSTAGADAGSEETHGTAAASAPLIAASGRSRAADEILRLAREHDVPLRQDAALADSLASLDIGRSIPPELFRAVAEVLVFLHKMNGP